MPAVRPGQHSHDNVHSDAVRDAASRPLMDFKLGTSQPHDVSNVSSPAVEDVVGCVHGLGEHRYVGFQEPLNVHYLDLVPRHGERVVVRAPAAEFGSLSSALYMCPCVYSCCHDSDCRSGLRANLQDECARLFGLPHVASAMNP